MGNCCKLSEKKEKVEAVNLASETGTLITEDRGHKRKPLKVYCESPEIHLLIPFRGAIPIQDVKEQIVEKCSGFDLQDFSLFRGNLEVLDATATLQQLGILPGDTLTMQFTNFLEDSDDIIASEGNSISQPKEETTSKEVASIMAKKALSSRNIKDTDILSPKKPAQELWRTALPSPPARHLINCDPLDVSSFTNITQDRSIRAPQLNFQVRIPRSMNSDDSNIEDRRNPRENSYLQDLKGPFFMFQKE